MKDFNERLVAVMQKGGLTTADAARLFDRHRRTVSDWTDRGSMPTGALAEDAFKRLEKLEEAVAKKRGFPIPLRLSKGDRVKYVDLVGEGKIGIARIFAKVATSRR